MNILQLITRYDYGGAESHLTDLSNTLVSKGHKVWVVAPEGRQRQLLGGDVVFTELDLNPFLLPIQVFRLVKLIKKHKIDIIHAHQRLAIYTAAWLSRLTAVPMVATVHGRTRYDLRTAFVRKSAKKLFFVSERVLEVSSAFEQINEKSVVVPNGVVITEPSGTRNPFSILYISRIDNKHAALLLMLIEQVIPALIELYPEISLHIVGEGKGLAMLRRRVEQFHQKHQRIFVFLHGYQDRMLPFLQSSSLLIGSGRAALMALASACPVLSVNNMRCGQLVSVANYDALKKNNFLDINSSPPTADGLREKLNDFFSQPDYWTDQADQLKNRVVAELNQDDIVRRIVAEYERVVSF